MGDKEVPSWLGETSFEGLFMRGEASRVLARPGVEAELSGVVADDEVAPKLRVLANELLVEAGQPSRPELADAYCRTLPEDFAHNWWGMPGQYLERLGRTTVAFGRRAAPCLSRLFDDRRRLGYFGSEEPTLSKEMQYRVCDLAAYLASEILGVEYEDAKEPGARDEFIAGLRANAGL
jgi:hypothetical protein